MSAELIVLLCAAAANIALWLYFFRKYRTRFSPEHILRDIRVEVDKLITEISREADRDISLLEGRIRGLKSLIEEADRRIALGNRETSKRETEQRFFSDPSVPDGKAFQAAPKTAAVPAYDAAGRYRRTTGTARKTPEENAVGGVNELPFDAVPAGSVPVLSSAPNQIKPKKSVREQILELHTVGYSSEMIAEKLSVTVSEVDLTVSLYMKS